MNPNRATQRYLTPLHTLICDLEIYPRFSPGYEFDQIALGIVAKAFQLSESCIRLMEFECIDEAYGLSRSIVECAATLRYLTSKSEQKDARTKKYMEYFTAEKMYHLKKVRASKTDPQRLQKLEQYARERKYESAGVDLRRATRHWSGSSGFISKAFDEEHPLDATRSDQELPRDAHILGYHQTSQFVHCSVWSLWNYLPHTAEPYVPGCLEERFGINSEMTYLNTFNYLIDCCKYALYGLNICEPSELERLRAAFTEELWPVAEEKAERLLYGTLSQKQA